MREGVPDADGVPVLGVSELVELLRGTLRDAFGEVRVEGEIASLFRSRPGHLYFDLKDEGALVRAVMFRGRRARSASSRRTACSCRRAADSTCTPSAAACSSCSAELRPCGEGALRAAFEKLKRAARGRGSVRRRAQAPLPFLPRRIGIVTSIQGAVIHDFLRALRRRFPASEVVLCDARVQGEGAWREIVRGLHLLDADPTVEVIVLARGGGSLEDLWNFNREELVRAVFDVRDAGRLRDRPRDRLGAHRSGRRRARGHARPPPPRWSCPTPRSSCSASTSSSCA